MNITSFVQQTNVFTALFTAKSGYGNSDRNLSEVQLNLVLAGAYSVSLLLLHKRNRITLFRTVLEAQRTDWMQVERCPLVTPQTQPKQKIMNKREDHRG